MNQDRRTQHLCVHYNFTYIERAYVLYKDLICALCSVVSDSDPRDCSPPGPLSMGFSRQEYWSGLPCPPPGDVPDPGTEPTSLVFPDLPGGFFTTVPPGKPQGPNKEA